MKKNRITHAYSVGDKVLLFTKRKTKLDSPTEGPYSIMNEYDNGTIKIRRNTYDEIINMRRVKPFKE